MIKRCNGCSASLFKKGLSENSSNNVVGMIKRCNDYGATVALNCDDNLSWNQEN
ncbi:hypothetical protein [Methanosarcina sp. Kolksee]|uniref:hypothetical protein n=1 Tax=Methanosarcina sp. Kolksee TaxID=1434099 RepID=UPI000A6640D2|nr:hypothetical protein [Methanosarcina sp. Kolksee]